MKENLGFYRALFEQVIINTWYVIITGKAQVLTAVSSMLLFTLFVCDLRVSICKCFHSAALEKDLLPPCPYICVTRYLHELKLVLGLAH